MNRCLPYDNLWLNFVATARKNPDKTALRCNSTLVTYDQLRHLAESRASSLGELAALSPGSRVLLLLSRDAEFIAMTLAVWKLDCTMIPLDSELTPGERAEQVIEESQCDLVVTNRENAAALTGKRSKVVAVEDLVWSEVDKKDTNEVKRRSAPAYIMFTSGSSGRPKGVVVPHCNVVNVLEHFCAEVDLSWSKWLAVTTFQFDISVLEYMLPLVIGKECLVADSRTCRNGSELLRLLLQEKVDIMQATPTTWQLLVTAGLLDKAAELRPRLRVLCGGEPFPSKLRCLCEVSKMVLNCYGPTETTIWSATYRVTAEGDGAVPIGKPIRDTVFEITDSGELLIGGAGVASGYFKADLAAPCQTGGFTVEGWYATGDRVAVDADGNYLFRGRMSDTQVKVRGYRIELGEIEVALGKLLGDQIQCAVVPHNDHLAAFAVGTAEASLNVPSLKRQLGRVLPPYMIPTWFRAIPFLPVTLNGKLDRKALSAYPVLVDTKKPTVSVGCVRDRIKECLRLVLGSDVVEDAPLAEQGVTSLLAVVLVEALSETLGVSVDVEHVFAHARAESFISFVEDLGVIQPHSTDGTKTKAGKKSKKLDPFMAACQDGTVLQAYSAADIKKKCNSVTDRFGSSPFHYAAGAGHLDVCKALLAMGADASYGDNKSGRNALHWAARNGRDGMVDWLLDACHLPVDSDTKDGTTPLQLACWGGFPTVCDVLVRRGADVHHVNRWGCIVTHFAALSGKLETMKWCHSVLSPAELVLGNDQGHTALHKAAYGGHRDICEWLITLDCFKELLDTPDVRGQTPAVLARKGGHEELGAWFDECTQLP
ncbi:hypothetical protein FOL47_010881 [Perkinsus chesapeaki]|uniref:Carrier domain-containing protein n=1 Tax=Perkinsus chesapeaki TaxID=330153 RepID=A0A7J6MNM9_PERCH|nr:hypothetical protein FOL47_010881 [Perkinsus chesapeaki]